MATSPIDKAAQLEVLLWAAWTPVDWLVHGFSTRGGGVSTAYASERSLRGELNLSYTADDAREHVSANRQALVRSLNAAEMELVTVRQVHSKEVHRVGGACNETGDGLMTNEPGLLLAILTADCVPILIADRERKAVAAFHAGWRGTVQRIVEEGVARMGLEFGSRVQDLSAVIGPCIGPCCYAVGEEVRAEFTAAFAYADALFSEARQGDAAPALHLDLVEANRRQLLAAGMADDAVHAMHECTGCQPENFFSYRKSGGRTGRMMSVIGMRAGA
jgi:hypothetical protein